MLEPRGVLLATVLGCVLLYELLVRRIGWLQPLFGLKRQVRAARVSHGEHEAATQAGTP